MTLRITRFLDSDHRPGFQILVNAMFRKLDLFSSLVNGRHLRTETDPVSETFLSSIYNSGRWTKWRMIVFLSIFNILLNSSVCKLMYRPTETE
jgi:hypothetical protein